MELAKPILLERQIRNPPLLGLDGTPPLIKQIRKLPRRNGQSLGYFWLQWLAMTRPGAKVKSVFLPSHLPSRFLVQTTRSPVPTDGVHDGQWQKLKRMPEMTT